MLTCLIVHGAYGHPQENWIPWLRKELELLNYEVIAPHFPTPENQSLDTWIAVFEPYREELTGDAIVIGHSLGAAFLLTILEGLACPIQAAYFVAGFISPLGNPLFDKFNRTFVEKSFEWERIKRNVKRFYVFHADNDPYVPLEKAQELAACLGVEVTMVKGAGHFNEESGYTRFPLLLERIRTY